MLFFLGTYGAYLPKVIESDVRQYVYIMNIYHEAFLCWGFKKALQGNLIKFRYYEKATKFDKISHLF